MPILAIFLVCLLLFMLFPKGFKFMVGTFTGMMFGGLAWALAGICSSSFVTVNSFITFIIIGIVCGWVLAAKG